MANHILGWPKTGQSNTWKIQKAKKLEDWGWMGIWNNSK